MGQIFFTLTHHKFHAPSDGSWSKILVLGWVKFLLLVSGQPSLDWVWKISPKNLNFSPLGRLKSHQVPCQTQVSLLFTAGQNFAWVGSGPIFNCTAFFPVDQIPWLLATALEGNLNGLTWPSWLLKLHYCNLSLHKLTTISNEQIVSHIEMGPDPTRAYFWPAVNKRPTRLWPRYFLTQPEAIFFIWRKWLGLPILFREKVPWW